jgi:hypothetical protein
MTLETLAIHAVPVDFTYTVVDCGIELSCA